MRRSKLLPSTLTRTGAIPRKAGLGALQATASKRQAATIQRMAAANHARG
jgi:hypothetical protein